MSDSENERARDDFYSGRRVDMDRQSESYVLARQRLDRAAQDAARRSESQGSGSPERGGFGGCTPFGGPTPKDRTTRNVPTKLVFAAAVLIIIAVVQWLTGDGHYKY